jgi:hypothetical protein
MSDTRDIWSEVLNPDIARSKVIYAGLLLVAHERLVDTICSRPLGFFANEWTAAGPVESDDFRQEVLALDPLGKNDRRRGSLAWLTKLGAIGADDVDAFRRITADRNRLAHELSALLLGRVPSDFSATFEEAVGLLKKIETWWIINVELDTDPELAGGELSASDVMPGSCLALDLLRLVLTTEGDERWDLYRQFHDLVAPQNPT